MEDIENVFGRIHSTETFGSLDGPGVRFVLFLQGCHLRCLYCHNADTWDTNLVPQLVTAKDMTAKILEYKNFIRTGGVTLSGGEPLLQSKFCHALTTLLHREGIQVAIDTAGSVPLSASAPALDACDLVLLDIKALDPELCIRLTGKDNANCLSTLDYCERTKKPVWLRHVLVPGYTLDRMRLTELAIYLRAFSCIQKVELLPFHKMGEFKWTELGYDYLLGNTLEPTPSQVAAAKEIFTSYGLPL